MTRIGLSVITCVARAQNGSRHVRICHDLQKRSLGPRRMSASLSLAGLPRGRSFPLPRTGRPFEGRMGYGGIGRSANMTKPKRKRPAASQPRSWCRVRRCQLCSRADRRKFKIAARSQKSPSRGVISCRRGHAASFNNLRASCTVAGRRPYRSQTRRHA